MSGRHACIIIGDDIKLNCQLKHQIKVTIKHKCYNGITFFLDLSDSQTVVVATTSVVAIITAMSLFTLLSLLLLYFCKYHRQPHFKEKETSSGERGVSATNMYANKAYLDEFTKSDESDHEKASATLYVD